MRGYLCVSSCIDGRHRPDRRRRAASAAFDLEHDTATRVVKALNALNAYLMVDPGSWPGRR